MIADFGLLFREELICRGVKTVDPARVSGYFYELVTQLPDNRLQDLSVALEDYSQTGKTTRALQNLICRVACLCICQEFLDRADVT